MKVGHQKIYDFEWHATAKEEFSASRQRAAGSGFKRTSGGGADSNYSTRVLTGLPGTFWHLIGLAMHHVVRWVIDGDRPKGVDADDQINC